MEASTTTADECDATATIVKQKGLSAEQRKALEIMTVVEGKSSIATAAAVAVKASTRVYGNAAAVEVPIKIYIDSLSPHALTRGKLLKRNSNKAAVARSLHTHTHTGHE